MANQVAYSADPLITIAIPTRNRAALLRACVASALAQTYPNIEVLVSNNASTDNTSEILRSFGDPRVREVVNLENIGLNRNWNRCLDEAAGEYFVILSDDNTLKPTFLESCVSLLREDPGLPIVAGGFEFVMTAENRTVPAVLTKRLQTGIWDGAEILIEHLRGNFLCGTLSCAIRTDILRRNGGFPVECVVGEELVLGRIFLEGRAGLINEHCASHLCHTHPTVRHSVRMGIDARFNDACRVMEALSDAANLMVLNERTRRAVQRHARTYVWHGAIQELASYREEGASLIDVARRLWDWRRLLAQCTFSNFVAALRLRPVGRILLPSSAIQLIRSSLSGPVATDRPPFAKPSKVLVTEWRKRTMSHMNTDSFKGWIKSSVWGYDLMLLKKRVTGQWRKHPDFWLGKLLAGQKAKLLQIGSFDGKTGDPLHQLIRKRGSDWRCVFVEPAPYLFERLKENYRFGNDGQFSFENAAIGNEQESVNFFVVNPRAAVEIPDLPEYALMVSSLSREHIVKQCDGVLEPYIEEITVRCIDIRKLIQKYEFDDIDMLHIDAEGYDWKILSMLDWDRFSAKFLLLEFCNLEKSEYDEAIRVLGQRYVIFRFEGDLLCVLKDAYGELEPVLAPIGDLIVEGANGARSGELGRMLGKSAHHPRHANA